MFVTRSRLPLTQLKIAATPRVSHPATNRRSPAVPPRAEMVSVDDSRFAVGPMFARGTYGSLHRAVQVDHPSQRLVAKKMLVGPGSKRGVGADDASYQLRPADKIETEIAVMRAVRSPLRPKAAEVGEHAATLIMPYRDGDLEGINKASGGLAQHAKRDMLRSALAQTSDELAQMHQANYMHLDIKPSNMFFDRQGSVCMGDFGLAHAFTDGEPLRLRRGSPAMMAPEALLDKALTPKGETWSLFVSWLDLAVGPHNNAFVTEPSSHLNYWRAKHGAAPFSVVIEAADGPFRTFFSDLFSWQAENPGPHDAQKLAEENDHPIGQTFARALAFDPEMTTLGLKNALVRDPQSRMTVAAYRDQIRALQPADSLAEAVARQNFGTLAETNTAGDRQFAALRQEAALLRDPTVKKPAGAKQGGWMRGLRHALAC